jgi:hypothetical protein
MTQGLNKKSWEGKAQVWNLLEEGKTRQERDMDKPLKGSTNKLTLKSNTLFQFLMGKLVVFR